MVVIDATPLSLGIELIGGVMSKIIPKGSFIPTKKSQSYTNTVDNQDMIRISIYEGERPLVKDNHLLGTFDLTGIKKLPKGKAQIEVTFDIDDNGILSVTASDKDSGSKNEITISNDSGRLSKEDIERMLREAEEFAE